MIEIDYEKYPCPEVDDLNTSGVLSSDEIRHYSGKYRMIEPFELVSLKPAGYELCLGEDYAIGGKRKKLYDLPDKDILEIPPFEVVIISTKEIINLPRFIIGRWNLRVKKIYEGLLWTGALQVDPGYIGYLFCPIYNLSDKVVRLRLGERIVLMDFVKTTPFTDKCKDKAYHRPPRRQKLEDYSWSLQSALFTEAAKKIEKIDKRTTRVESLVGLVLTSIAVMFAALSIMITSFGNMDISYPIWVFMSVSISIIALSVCLFTKTISLPINGKKTTISKKQLFEWLVVIYIILSAIAIFCFMVRGQ
ncbi:MAG: hypothetical protein KAS32_11805 [Candidatus Peribacteraceae bacterium]|nr:hypothetical protein [Candidatus Peribacteraceae bacterium]